MTTLAGLITAAVCLALTAAALAAYPLAPWALASFLVIYAAALWHWPGLWLAVIPAVLPTLDLTPWTGWTQVGEPDLFVLVTIAILAVRAPPRRADSQPEGLAAIVVLLTLISYLLSGALGLALPGPEGGSDNVYLRPDNALRLSKGFFTALAATAISARENARARRRDGLVGRRYGRGPCTCRHGGHRRARAVYRHLRLYDRLPYCRHVLGHECRWRIHRRLSGNGAAVSIGIHGEAARALARRDVRHRDGRRIRSGCDLCAYRLRCGVAFDADRRFGLGVGGTPRSNGHFCPPGPSDAGGAVGRRHRHECFQ